VNTIDVVAPGLQTTVQDLGREGFGPLGVSPSGAADVLSLRIGNRLVGNPESAPALEMTLLGGSFLFRDNAVVALAGSDFGASLDEQPAPLWTSFEVRARQTLRVGPTRSGARCYLCVRGGIAVPPFLGSASTHLLSGLGGFDGRALRKQDVLQIGSNFAVSSSRFGPKRVSPHALKQLAPSKILRATPGPQSGQFSQPAAKNFYSQTYRVSEESNRMGLRLEGAPISDSVPGEMVSEGMPLGAVQITSAGLPIILFVEQQTTGGYAKIANVISADFHSLGQLRPRDEIRFAPVTFEEARRALIEQEQFLASDDWIVNA
jgi:antagonist of KipI